MVVNDVDVVSLLGCVEDDVVLQGLLSLFHCLVSPGRLEHRLRNVPVRPRNLTRVFEVGKSDYGAVCEIVGEVLVEDLSILLAQEAVVDEVVEVEARNGLQVRAHGDVEFATALPVLDLSVDALPPEVALVAQNYQVKYQAEGGESGEGELGILLQAGLHRDYEKDEGRSYEEERKVNDLYDSHHIEDAHLELSAVEEEDVLCYPHRCQDPICLFQEKGVEVEY